MKNKILIVVDTIGEHHFEIAKETEDVIELSTTLLDGTSVRFNKKERQLEYFNGSIWDVYVTDDCIFQVDIIE